jgi:DNA-binding LacI/PurR family transcriptional regulator
VARRAGVAVSTVSYALSGKRPLLASTRTRILRAIDELGYEPSPAARALPSRSSRTIALFLPSRRWRGMPETHTFIAGAAEATSEAGYGLLFSAAPSDPREVTEVLDAGRADGVILMEVFLEDARVERLRARGDAFALIGHCADNTGVSFVDFDFADAVRQGVLHLARLGHSRVALFNCSAGATRAGYGPGVRSLQAFTETTAELGLEPIVIGRDDTQAQLSAAARRLLAREPRCRGVVTVAAHFTGVLTAAAERGLLVGHDVDVVSVTTPQLAELLVPTLATVDFPALEMGRLGAEMLIRRLAGERVDTQTLLRGELRVRGVRRRGPSVSRAARAAASG